MTLVVSEVFGPTIQGEGPSAGQQCAFIRLSMCNLDCSWCDTPYTWDWTGHNGVAYDRRLEQSHATVEELVEQVEAMGVRMVVISGGEPLLQRNNVEQLVEQLCALNVRVEIETNGTRAPSDQLLRLAWWNVSPKLSHAQCSTQTIFPDVLRRFATSGRAVFKFVARDVLDLEEVDAIAEVADLPSTAVWIMPEGRDADVLVQRMSELGTAVVKRGWSLSTRLHVLAWGDRRGV